jgi:hypothetical protein
MTFFQVGFHSRAGYNVRYDKQYETIEAARTALKQLSPGHCIFKVTVEEVK